jgi:UPF0755 protein
MFRPPREVFLRRLFLILTALCIGCVDPDAPANPADSTEVAFQVPTGATARGIGPALAEEGLISGEFGWTLYLRQNPDEATCLKAGRFLVRRDMSMREVMSTLCGTPLPEDVPFTVLEGWRIRDIDAALAEKGWIAAGAYTAIAESKEVALPFPIESATLEGYLYPETYMVTPPPRFDPKEFIERQLRSFDEKFRTPNAKALEARGLHPVVVVASMVEREEPTDANRPIVAGVLWKRLDHKWQLGVDATSRYPLEDWTDNNAFVVRLRDPDDPYNTRLRKGLPPTAIGNASLRALEAALHPEDSPWWFYLHDGNGVFHGARTGDEHDANRAKYGVY